MSNKKEIFKTIFTNYKFIQKNKDNVYSNNKIISMLDDNLHTILRKALENFKLFTQYLIITHEKYEGVDVLINIPENIEEFMELYNHFSYALGPYLDNYIKILSLEDWRGLVIYGRISPLLFYSTINDNIVSKKIKMFENDIREFYTIMASMVKTKIPEYLNDLINSKEEDGWDNIDDEDLKGIDDVDTVLKRKRSKAVSKWLKKRKLF